MGFKGSSGSRFRVQGSGFKVQGSGFKVQGSGFKVQGSRFRVLRVVRCIIIWKRRGVLEYMIFAKDKKPVNLWNLQNQLNL